MNNQNTKTPAYYALLPKELHKKADDFIRHLSEFPYQTPTHCVHCGSGRLNQRKEIYSQGIRNYHCSHCDKVFNQLTGTPFARSVHLEKWPAFAYWRLSGLSILEISHKTGISNNACKLRNKKLIILLKEHAPELYQWWYDHQTRKNIGLTPLIESQKATFQAWLQQQVTMDNIHCPHCGRNHTCHRINPQRPQFSCTYCKKSFNPLQTTPFKKMHFIHLWPTYFDMMINGFSHRDISVQLNISRRSLIYWHNNFLKQMQIMELNALEQWMRWQMKCRISQVCRETQQKR